MMRPPYNPNRVGAFGCLAAAGSVLVLAWGIFVLVASFLIAFWLFFFGLIALVIVHAIRAGARWGMGPDRVGGEEDLAP